jgi:hypothetical protein
MDRELDHHLVSILHFFVKIGKLNALMYKDNDHAYTERHNARITHHARAILDRHMDSPSIRWFRSGFRRHVVLVRNCFVLHHSISDELLLDAVIATR